MRTFVKHIRHPLKQDRYIGTIAIVQDGRYTGFGFSQCHPADTFSKKEGRNKALGRAVALNRSNIPTRPVALKLYRPDGSRYRVNPIQEALDEALQNLVEVVVTG